MFCCFEGVIFVNVLTAENMKKAENAAVLSGMTYAQMMINAGNGCGDVISKCDKSKKTVILCGKGKNGGDGFVIAQRLRQNGFEKVFIVLVHGKTTDELCVQMYNETEKYPIDITDMSKEKQKALYHIQTAEIIVDCIFGIGFKGELKGCDLEAVKKSNENEKAYKFAIDIPSGLSADGIYNKEEYFNADETLSIIAYKPVHVFKPTSCLCGKKTVINIGVDEKYTSQFAENYETVSDEEVFLKIKHRNYNDHKGTFGKAFVIAGSKNMTGCVYLCNQAAVELGCGIVVSVFPDCIYSVVASKINEPVLLPLKSNADGYISSDESDMLLEKMNDARVIAIGCGIGVNEDTKRLTEFIIKNAQCPVIVDADGLNCISENPHILKNAKSEIILTPHLGEMSRLTGKSISEIENNKIKVASEFANEYGVTVLLKGENTIIADNKNRLCVNYTGNPSMARGGSGDVLTGIITALVPQTDDIYTAACIGAYIHGGAGDFVAEKFGVLSATPKRVIENIHDYLMQLQ